MYRVLGSLVSLCGLLCAGPSLVLIAAFGLCVEAYGRAQTARTVGTTRPGCHVNSWWQYGMVPKA
jgi:hypothetical protein